MNLIRTSLLAVALAGTAGLDAQTAPVAAPVQPAASAPAPRPRTSPHDTISARLDGNRVTIVYGRPYSKDPKTGEIRKIWGALVPPGKPWRTGADEATLLITQQALDLGGTALPAGAYTLYTLLADDGSAQLLINKKIGQWGADPYDASQEFAKVALTKEPLAPQLDQFMMALDKNPSGGGVIKLMWENTQYSVPYTVKK
jgi:hypothetical protein